MTCSAHDIERACRSLDHQYGFPSKRQYYKTPNPTFIFPKPLPILKQSIHTQTHKNARPPIDLVPSNP
ncbi:hypothetical protein BDD12DRAFT_823838 [Trichophaea hybrida]|nr:hypothetical protein BDD12DRAFT_823838 [Trichophaea hybrida]